MEMIKEKTVTQKDLASALKSGNADVLSTPTVLAWMEETASEFAQTFLSNDEITVGAHVTLDHVAPAWPGEKVKVIANLIEKSNRKFSFHIEVKSGEKLIARADHVRVAVKRGAFKHEN
ncbi:MAG: thioesterase family protein [Athalassotoga sp.]|uniref:thioesterase family protein n=1 Tax=Athalassotoga sp. TaxID=2022597 RepID=UPI003CFED81E